MSASGLLTLEDGQILIAATGGVQQFGPSVPDYVYLDTDADFASVLFPVEDGAVRVSTASPEDAPAVDPSATTIVDFSVSSEGPLRVEELTGDRHMPITSRGGDFRVRVTVRLSDSRSPATTGAISCHVDAWPETPTPPVLVKKAPPSSSNDESPFELTSVKPLDVWLDPRQLMECQALMCTQTFPTPPRRTSEKLASITDWCGGGRSRPEVKPGADFFISHHGDRAKLLTGDAYVHGKYAVIEPARVTIHLNWFRPSARNAELSWGAGERVLGNDVELTMRFSPDAATSGTNVTVEMKQIPRAWAPSLQAYWTQTLTWLSRVVA